MQCFEARVGADRYRFHLLSLYPKFLHIATTLRRLQTQYRQDVQKQTLLKAKQRWLTQKWVTLLQAVGILANAYAPLPLSSCNNEDNNNREKSKTESSSHEKLDAHSYHTAWQNADEFLNNTIFAQFNKDLLQLKSSLRDGMDDTNNEFDQGMHNKQNFVLHPSFVSLNNFTLNKDKQNEQLQSSRITHIQLEGEHGQTKVLLPAFKINTQ